MIYIIIVLLIILLFIISILYIVAKKELKVLQNLHEELIHDHRSIKVKHGMSFEQLFPFMKTYPYNLRNFRFIGTPIDGISFEEDKIVFIEFKTGKSTLSSLQKKIKDLILKKKIEWKEIRDN